MNRLKTIKEVANDAKLSVSTIYRYFNDEKLSSQSETSIMMVMDDIDFVISPKMMNKMVDNAYKQTDVEFSL